MDASTRDLLGLGYGLIVGVSLGLTGGGGSIFAVPLLIYGLGVPVRTAIGLSLASVGVIAAFGAALRLKAREVEVPLGLIFAAGGMTCAPLGLWLGHFVPSAVLLSIFAALMAFVGWRMWQGNTVTTTAPVPCTNGLNRQVGPAYYTRLVAAGAAVGMLSGLFGIGGGFIIVPTLLYVTGTSIHRAVATSLLVIFLISLSGVTASIVHGQIFPTTVSALFVGGGFTGMFLGSHWRCRLSGPALRRAFATAMWAVGAYMLVKNLAPLAHLTVL